jgi:hypothetical protein
MSHHSLPPPLSVTIVNYCNNSIVIVIYVQYWLVITLLTASTFRSGRTILHSNHISSINICIFPKYDFYQVTSTDSVPLRPSHQITSVVKLDSEKVALSRLQYEPDLIIVYDSYGL